MNVKYSRKSLEFLAVQEKATVEAIKNAVKRLTLLPPEGDIKEMQDGERLRLKECGHRVIFRYVEENGKELLLIDTIGRRAGFSDNGETNVKNQINQIVALLDILPEKEQNLALELLKRIVLAWDNDYIKLTPDESIELSEAEKSGYADVGE